MDKDEVTKSIRIYKGNCAYSKITYRICRNGDVFRLTKKGWKSVQNALGKPKYIVILETFVGKKPHPKYECCHKNDNRDDNRVENLYWGTHAQNMADAGRNGRAYCPTKKMTPELIQKCVDLYTSGWLIEDISKEVNAGYGAIHRWLTGKCRRRKLGEKQKERTILKYQGVREEIRRQYKTGRYTRKDLAQKFSLSEKVVYTLTKDVNRPSNSNGGLHNFNS